MLNKVFLIGRLVADPELQHTNGGTPFSRMRIAVNTPYKDKSGEWQEDTLFIDVVLWGTPSERVVKKLSKGSRVLVVGSLRQSTWEKNGEKRSKIEVRAERVSALDYKRDSAPEEEEITEDFEF